MVVSFFLKKLNFLRDKMNQVWHTRIYYCLLRIFVETPHRKSRQHPFDNPLAHGDEST